MIKQLLFPLLRTEVISTYCYKRSALVDRPTVHAAERRCSMAFCAFLWLGSVLSWGKPRCIFADPCAHQQFWCRSTKTIWWVHVSLQSWADWQCVQNLCVRKWGFMSWAEELSGCLALEISIKGVYFALKIWSQPQQSAAGTCCNTQVLAKQLVGGWWWKFRAVFKAVQPISFVPVPEAWSVMGVSTVHLDLCESHPIPFCPPEEGISLGTYFSFGRCVKIHRKSLGRYFMHGYEWEKVLTCLGKLEIFVITHGSQHLEDSPLSHSVVWEVSSTPYTAAGKIWIVQVKDGALRS